MRLALGFTRGRILDLAYAVPSGTRLVQPVSDLICCRPMTVAVLLSDDEVEVTQVSAA
jgi:hypothetical protein